MEIHENTFIASKIYYTNVSITVLLMCRFLKLDCHEYG